MNEAGLWDWLRRNAPAGHWVRLENSVGLGTPDVNYKIKGGPEGWAELKYHDDCLSSTQPFKKKGLRTEQIFWIEDRVAAGGQVWIVAGLGKMVHFVDGSHARRFNRWTRAQLERRASWSILRGDGFANLALVEVFLEHA